MRITGKKIAIAVTVFVLLMAGAVFAVVKLTKSGGAAVEVEAVTKRDLEAMVSASGKIRAKREVNITSEVSGRVTKLAVNEGDLVKRGQFLLQIDPRLVASAVERGEAGLDAQRSGLEQARTQLEAARANLMLARQNLEREQELWKAQLTPRQNLERAESELKVRESELNARQAEIGAAQQRIRQQAADVDSARYNLSRVTIEAPIDGIITRRNVEEGETAQVGFTNNPSVVLLALADMSVIEAQIEVDETDIPTVQIGQAAKVTIDAIPDKTFAGKVTEIGNSPIQTAGATGQQATNFRVVVTLDGQIPEVRPGFTCTAEIITAKRTQALAVPIQAMAVRELIVDKDGNVVKQPKDKKPARKGKPEAVPSDETLPAGQTRKEIEGVFVVRGTEVEFVPAKTGIAGDRFFEVLSGPQEGDRVVIGPVSSVRDLADGSRVTVQDKKTRGRT
jgi:HlyD family secretion protein